MLSGTSRKITGRAIATRASAIVVAIVGVWGADPGVLRAQAFQVVWVTVGEVAAADDEHSPRAGRQLFDASDLMSMSLKNVKITRVDVQPSVRQIMVAEEVCLSSLKITAFDPNQRAVHGAPLSVAIRQDHKEKIGLRRSRQDICARPTEAGEFPIRFTSLLPAPDATMRGAQVFLRAAAPVPAQDASVNER
jgi:hypothetical protein